MPTLAFTHVEVYVVRLRSRRLQILLLRRSRNSSLPGVWQPVTGTIRRGESVFRGAAREVREETGLVPRRWWLLESPTLYFNRTTGALRALPRFVAEVSTADRVRRSPEHTAHAFVSAREARRRLLWESQREGLEALRRQVLPGGALARALEIPRQRFGRVPKRRP